LEEIFDFSSDIKMVIVLGMIGSFDIFIALFLISFTIAFFAST
jgi:hypothetical protein